MKPIKTKTPIGIFEADPSQAVIAWVAGKTLYQTIVYHACLYKTDGMCRIGYSFTLSIGKDFLDKIEDENSLFIRKDLVIYDNKGTKING